MNRFLHLTVLAIFALLCNATSAKSAASEVSQFLAVPFVASDRPDTTDFKTAVVSTPGSPFSVSMNTVPAPQGTYAGVVVTSTKSRYLSGFQNISFLLRGPNTTKVTVHLQRRGRSSFDYLGATASQGITGESATPGSYQLVSLNARQLGITPGSRIDRIVISPDSARADGSFLLNDIRINGVPVGKSLIENTKFYRVVNGTATGPLEQFAFAGTAVTAFTSMSLKNGTTVSQKFYISLVSPSAITDVTTINFTSSSGTVTPTAVGGPPNPNSLGTFTLTANQTISYSPTVQMCANFYCPVDPANPTNSQQCSGTVGATFAEININGGFEVVDISEVNGVNAQWQIIPPPVSSYTCTWSSGSYLQPNGGSPPAPNPQQYIPITSIVNNPGPYPFNGDIGNPGVYPFGCDLCISRDIPGCASITYPTSNTGCDNTGTPSKLPKDTYSPYGLIYSQSAYNLCQANRAPGCAGGTVALTLLSYPFGGTPASPHHPPPPHRHR